MRSTSRSLALAALALLLVVLAVPGARAQLGSRMNTIVDNMVGEGGDTPAARLIFVERDEELCVVIAVLTGPTSLKSPLFRFSRRVDGEPKSQKLSFDLPKKPESATQQGNRIQVWQGCATGAVAPATDPGAAAVIDIQYYDPRLLRERAEYDVAFPAAGDPRGVDVYKDSAGNLLFREYRPDPDELL
jgi:hypothetical protein